MDQNQEKIRYILQYHRQRRERIARLWIKFVVLSVLKSESGSSRASARFPE